LAPVGPGSIDFLYQLATDEATGWRWRFNGIVPRREAFEQSLWNGILTQFIVYEITGETMIGSVVAYNADLNHGFAYVAVAMTSEAMGSGAGIEAADLFGAHLFGCYRLRKLYLEVPEFNIGQFETAIGWLFREEANLVGHLYYWGRYWDRRILAVYREDYESIPVAGNMLGRRRRPSSY